MSFISRTLRVWVLGIVTWACNAGIAVAEDGDYLSLLLNAFIALYKSLFLIYFVYYYFVVHLSD